MKKIKDLTMAEIKRICEVHFCYECPFFKKSKKRGDCLLYIPSFIPNWMLDEEVEVLEEKEE